MTPYLDSTIAALTEAIDTLADVVEDDLRLAAATNRRSPIHDCYVALLRDARRLTALTRERAERPAGCRRSA